MALNIVGAGSVSVSEAKGQTNAHIAEVQGMILLSNIRMSNLLFKHSFREN